MKKNTLSLLDHRALAAQLNTCRIMLYPALKTVSGSLPLTNKARKAVMRMVHDLEVARDYLERDLYENHLKDMPNDRIERTKFYYPGYY
jgi:hypothetical protein